MHNWLSAFRPAAPNADWRERSRVVVGALLGILLTAVVCRPFGAAWMVAPLGASAVLVFAVPASPLAQPWSVIGGNTLSAAWGLLCAQAIHRPELAAAVAVAGAIALMFALRCLHPPGGAAALLVALGGLHDPQFLLFPVLGNSLLLVAVAMVFNALSGRPYPPRPAVARDAEASAVDADLDAVLARHNQVLDVGRDELKALLQDTQLRGYQRKLADLRCRDIMSRPVIQIGPRASLSEAWAMFAAHRIKALPVVDASGGIVGIVTPADFMRAPQGPRRIGEIMSRRVRVASADRHLAELIPLFASTGHHHIPVVDGADSLVGMLTQSDVMAALAAR